MLRSQEPAEPQVTEGLPQNRSLPREHSQRLGEGLGTAAALCGMGCEPSLSILREGLSWRAEGSWVT